LVQPTDKQHLLDTGILGSLVYILQGLLSINESYSKEARPDDGGSASEEKQTDSYTSRVRRLEVIPQVVWSSFWDYYMDLTFYLLFKSKLLLSNKIHNAMVYAD
jgi:hypothetical protein